MRARTRQKVPILSFFSGCGGFDYGFASTGFSVKLALDVDPIAVKSYNHNLGNNVCRVADLADMNGNEIATLYEAAAKRRRLRGVIGGAPCQTFSNGNVYFRADDKRHFLPRKYACILRILNLKYKLDFFVFENVKGIISSRHLKEYRTVKRLFSRAGFRLFEGELDAADFGVAQHRRRVFIVGLNRDKYPRCEFKFPEPETVEPVDIRSVIGDLPEPLLFKLGLTRDDIPHHPNHWAMYPKSRRFYDGSLKAGHSNGRSFRVLEWDRPSYTVAYGNREVHVHPNTRRRLSVYEAMLIQGFPQTYELIGTLSQQIRQVSDAIPPKVGEVLGRSICRALYTP